MDEGRYFQKNKLVFITNEPLLKEFKRMSLKKKESDPKVTSKKQQGILRNKITKRIGKAKKKV